MQFTRRQILAAAAARAFAQSRPGIQQAPAPRTTPPLCLYSQALVKIDYADLAPALRGLGFDGCDLSVQPGGHVAPHMASLDLTRAVESLRGGGIDVPLITTALTSAQDPNAEEVLGIAGIIKISYFRPGHWALTGDPQTRIAAARRQIANLAALGRAAGIAMAFHNQAGNWVGASVADADRDIIGALDPRFAGYDFDIANATVTAPATPSREGAWEALRIALPRLKAVTVADFKWAQKDGAREPVPCPLGEGVVDFERLAAALAKANFLGPISLHVDYQPTDDVSAIQRNLEFLKKKIAAAYSGGTA